MRIAINTRFLLSGKLEGIGMYTQEIFKRVVQQMPEHEFYFLFDRPFSDEFIFAKNVIPLVVSPPARLLRDGRTPRDRQHRHNAGVAAVVPAAHARRQRARG